MICRWLSFVNSPNIHWVSSMSHTIQGLNVNSPPSQNSWEKGGWETDKKSSETKINNALWRKLKELTKWQGKRSHPTAGGQLTSKRSIWPKPERYKKQATGQAGSGRGHGREKTRSASWISRAVDREYQVKEESPRQSPKAGNERANYRQARRWLPKMTTS